MTWDGFIPDSVFIPCKMCGKNLETCESGWTGSRYFGTMNGLCYSCTSSGEYLEKKYADGAEIWNFPPHCPSYRRDRETFIYYPGCKNEKCEKGRVYVSRADGFGGSYYEYCKDCTSKYHNHPGRKLCETIFYNICRLSNKVFQKEIKKVEKSKKLSKDEKDFNIGEIKKILLERRSKLLEYLKHLEFQLKPKLVFERKFN